MEDIVLNMKNYIMKLNVIITLITIILFSITLINIIRQTIKTLNKMERDRERTFCLEPKLLHLD